LRRKFKIFRDGPDGKALGSHFDELALEFVLAWYACFVSHRFSFLLHLIGSSLLRPALRSQSTLFFCLFHFKNGHDRIAAGVSFNGHQAGIFKHSESTVSCMPVNPEVARTVPATFTVLFCERPARNQIAMATLEGPARQLGSLRDPIPWDCPFRNFSPALCLGASAAPYLSFRSCCGGQAAAD